MSNLHSSLTCKLTPRCVRCSENHFIANCPNAGQTPKCALCKGPHTANYRGCLKKTFRRPDPVNHPSQNIVKPNQGNFLPVLVPAVSAWVEGPPSSFTSVPPSIVNLPVPTPASAPPAIPPPASQFHPPWRTSKLSAFCKLSPCSAAILPLKIIVKLITWIPLSQF